MNRKRVYRFTMRTLFNPFKKSLPADPTQVLAALARVVRPVQERDIVESMEVEMLCDVEVRRTAPCYSVMLENGSYKICCATRRFPQ